MKASTDSRRTIIRGIITNPVTLESRVFEQECSYARSINSAQLVALREVEHADNEFVNVTGIEQLVSCQFDLAKVVANATSFVGVLPTSDDGKQYTNSELFGHCSDSLIARMPSDYINFTRADEVEALQKHLGECQQVVVLVDSVLWNAWTISYPTTDDSYPEIGRVYHLQTCKESVGASRDALNDLAKIESDSTRGHALFDVRKFPVTLAFAVPVALVPGCAKGC